jgi:hypothetical protein
MVTEKLVSRARSSDRLATEMKMQRRAVEASPVEEAPACFVLDVPH